MTPEAIEQLIERSRQLQAEHATFIAADAPTAHVIDLLHDIRLAFIATDKMAVRRSVGWLGRLLGRDINLQADAEMLRARGPLLVHRADELAVRWQAHIQALDGLGARIAAMQSELNQAVAGLDANDDNRQRLQQLALLFDMSAAQQRAMSTQTAQLGRRFSDIRAGLLPMLAQTGIVDAAHKNSDLHSKASAALAALEAADMPPPSFDKDLP